MTATLIHNLTEFFGQPLQEQFYWVSILSCVAFVSAIVLREFCRTNWAKGCGRLLGLGGFFLLFCYAVHATDVATRMERMANEQQQKVPTSEIATSIPQSDETIVWNTASGNVIRFTPRDNGRRASVSAAVRRSGCESCNAGGHRQSDFSIGGDSDAGRVASGREAAGTLRMPESMIGQGF